MDDILKRLGVVESSVAALAGDFREMKGMLPSLATKSDVESVRTEVQGVRIEIQTVRTDVEKVRTEVEKVRTEVEKGRTDVADAVSSMIKWLVGTVVAVGALGFSIAKFVH